MNREPLHPSIAIIATFLFLFGSDVIVPNFRESVFRKEVVTAGKYLMKAGEDIQKAENEIECVGKRIAGIVREVTAYNVGVSAQTSDTPCIGASGRDLCELVARNAKVCAANFVPFGTILQIDAWGECIVLDRMHPRFSHRVDIAMSDDEIEEARRFGLQKRLVKAMF